MKRILLVILFVFAFAFAPILLMAVVQNWSATNLQAVSSFYVGSKNVFSFLDGLVDNQTVTNSIGDSTITQPKLSQALVDFIGSGGSVTNNPDDQTLEATGVGTIALKENYAVAEDIADLQSWAQHDLETGDVVYLREVATGGYGGGEMVYFDSTDLKTLIGSAVPDSGIVFSAPTADRVWARKAFVEKPDIIYPQWYGAKFNGVADDSTAIQKAVNRADDYGGIVQFGEGTYSFNGPIILNPRDEADALIIRGVGEGKSRLTLLGNTDALKVNKNLGGGTSYSVFVEITNLTITGPGKATSTGKGIELDSTGFCIVKGNIITGFEYGVYANQSNNNIIDNNYITSNKYGIWLQANANGNTIRNNTISQADSVGITISNGYANEISGGEFGRNYVAIDLLNSAFCSVNDVNFEADKLWEFRLDLNSRADAKNIRTLRDAPTGPKLKLAKLTNSSSIHFIDPVISGYDMTNDSSHVWISGNTSLVTCKAKDRLNVVRIRNAQSSQHYYAQEFITQPANQGIAADSTHRGKTYIFYQRGTAAAPVTTEDDNLQFKQRQWDGNYTTNYLTDGTQWFFSATGASHARVTGIAYYSGYKAFNLAAGDSTDVTITIDSVQTIYGMSAVVYDDLSTGIQADCNPVLLSFTQGTSAGSGTLVFRVWHRYNTGGTLTGLRLHYIITARKYYD